ncbi:hypothetical protein BGAPBR_Q0018 (plasmid) [Borreliella garinii PBr]|uniref:Uncharacterized protein n=1 Tax=Borreliella garinii PBr TaxID=498743 RepID=B8F195_BORGR|nr:hypothetical protein BGAPBR_Q0018 [Borreliella garinii PBr]
MDKGSYPSKLKNKFKRNGASTGAFWLSYFKVVAISSTPFSTVSSDAKICIVKLKINIKMKKFSF